MFLIRNFTAEMMFPSSAGIEFSDYDPVPGAYPDEGDLAAWFVVDMSAAVRPQWAEAIRGAALSAIAGCQNQPSRALHVFPVVAVNELDPVNGDRTRSAELDRLNQEIREAISGAPNIFWVDLGALVDDLAPTAFEPRHWYSARQPFSPSFVHRFPSFWAAHLNSVKSVRHKILVTDLDNTLWGGVLGDDGVGGITIGGAYPGNIYLDVQLVLRDLYERGVLLSIASKNDEDIVWEAMESRPEMIVKREMFLYPQIHWEDKAGSIEAIAASLDVGLDSIVFLDDSPQERLQVKTALPEVEVPDFPEQPYELPAAVSDIVNRFFRSHQLTEEDRVRSDLYRSGMKRDVVRRKTDTRSYLETLKTVVTRLPSTPDLYPRLAQLTQKTNQFNMTTRRFEVAELARWNDDDQSIVAAFRIADIYAEQGLSALVLTHREGDHAYIDNFIMSCRLLGRQIESAIIKHVLERLRSEGCEDVVGLFESTSRNGRAEGFYEQHGFEQTDSGNWKRTLGDELNTTGLEHLVTVIDGE